MHAYGKGKYENYFFKYGSSHSKFYDTSHNFINSKHVEKDLNKGDNIAAFSIELWEEAKDFQLIFGRANLIYGHLWIFNQDKMLEGKTQ